MIEIITLIFCTVIVLHGCEADSYQAVGIILLALAGFSLGSVCERSRKNK